MSVRQRVLHSAPLIAFALAIVFLALSLGGYDPADPPGHGAEPVNQPATNPCGPVAARIRPHLVQHAGLVVLAASSGPRRRQSASNNAPVCPRPARAGDRFWARAGRCLRFYSQNRGQRSCPAQPSAAADMWVPWSRSSSKFTLDLSARRSDPRRRRTFRPGPLPRRGLLVADPGNPSLASAKSGGEVEG